MALVCRFPDRKSAGAALAKRLGELEKPIAVLGASSGGLVVAAPIARALGAPLDRAYVRKLVHPREPDVVLGAVDLDGEVILNPAATGAEGLGTELVTELAYHTHQRLVARARDARVRTHRLLMGRTVVIVDDGLTTGLTLISALRWARRHGAVRRIVAVPVADRLIWDHLAEHADETVTLELRDDGPIARSDVYEDFRKVPSSTTARLLRSLRTAGGSRAASTPG